MLFSVIVPIYNVEKYLHKCVDSLIGQTYKDIEIILVDDGSPDNCPTICDEYAKKDSRIKVIHKQNGGLSDARNKGLEAATGEFVSFIDSDDYIELDTFERFSKFISPEIDMLVGDAIVEGGECPLDNPKHLQGKVLLGYDYFKSAVQYDKVPAAVWCYVHRRVFLIENDLRFKYGILHEDEQFTPRALLKAKGVCYTGIVFYHYVLRDGSITKRKDKRKNATDLLSTFGELEIIFRQIKDKKFKNNLLNSLAEKYFSMYVLLELNRYGKTFVRKKFVLRTAKKLKTRVKSWLFMINPKLYEILRKII